MSTSVGAIHVDLGLNSASFQKGVNDARKTAKGFGSDLKATLATAAKGFGAGLLAGISVGGVTAIVREVGQVADRIAQIGDEAAKAGVSTKVFQEWRYLAEQARIPIDSLTDGFKELAIRADEFATTGKGSAAEAFARLGLKPAEVKERLKDPADFMLLLMERTRQLGDTAAGIRIFDELFGGTGGERMVSLLQMSDQEVRNIISTAQTAGRVMDDELIAKTEELDKAFKGVAGTVSTYLQGAIIRAADDLYSFLELFMKWESVRKSTADERLAAIGKARLALEQQILKAKHEQSGITDNARDLGFGSSTSGVYSGQPEDVARLQQQMKLLADEEERILAARKGIDDLPARPTASTASTPSIVTGGSDSSKRSASADATEREREAVLRLIAALEEELRLVGATDLERETANTLRQAGAAATEEQRAKIVALVAALHAEEEASRRASDAAHELRNIGRDVLGGMVSDLREGKSAADILANALDRVADKLLSMALDGIFSPSGGGGFLSAIGNIFGFSKGGYTGQGGKDVPAGVVHRGEYVFSKKAVERLGAGYLDQMHRAANGYASGGYAGLMPTGGCVEEGKGFNL